LSTVDVEWLRTLTGGKHLELIWEYDADQGKITDYLKAYPNKPFVLVGTSSFNG